MPSPPQTQGAGAVLGELHLVPPEATIVLRGELDLDVVDELGRALALVAGSGVHRLVVDLVAVDFAGVRALALVHQAAAAVVDRGGRVEVVGASPVHARVLDLLGLPGCAVVSGR